jgi:hypothetical protein
MAQRTILEQYEYETRERGLSHEDALAQMAYMFPVEQLELLDGVYKSGFQAGKDWAY